MKSWLLVMVQFVCLIGIALSGPILARGPWLALQVGGGVVGLWALATMRLERLNVLPDVRDDTQLVQTGPYARVRHPMYTGLILLTLAMLISDFSWPRLAFWVGLVINFEVKLRYEESLLAARFPEYEAYVRQTARLLPGIY